MLFSSICYKGAFPSNICYICHNRVSLSSAMCLLNITLVSGDVGDISSCYRTVFCFKHLITFENMYQLSCWFHCADVFYIKFRLCETYKGANFVTRILLIETCWFTLNSNVIPPSFLAFHIPLVFAW